MLIRLLFLLSHFFVILYFRSWQLRWQQVVNQLLPINFDRENRPRRQDWRGELIETGMFYFSRRKLIEQMGVFQNERFVDFLSLHFVFDSFYF